MKRALATVCMSGSLANKLAAAAEAGFDGVEIFENDLTFFDGRPEDVRDLAASLGLEMIALQPFRDFEDLPEPQRSRAFERARRKFDLMLRLGTPLLLVCSSVSPNAVDDITRVAADLHDLGDLAAERGLTVGFEALSLGATRQRLPPGLGRRSACRPSPNRAGPRHVSRSRPEVPD